MTAAILLAVAAQAAACLPVTGDVIRAADMAPAVKAFASLPPDTRVGYSPAPGAKRVFDAKDLERAARRLGVALDETPEVCFEWHLTPPSEDRFREAMQKALGIPGARIEILETSTEPVPDGELVFDRSSLAPPPTTNPEQPLMWRGHVEYGERRRFSVWARLRIAAEGRRVVASEPIRAGEVVRPDQVHLESYEGFPFADSHVRNLDQVVGQIMRSSVREGEPIPGNTLDRPLDVSRSDLVNVIARSGAAVIKTEGRAESAGRRGETIPVRNVSSGAIFQAEVTGPGQVALILPN